MCYLMNWHDITGRTVATSPAPTNWHQNGKRCKFENRFLLDVSFVQTHPFTHSQCETNLKLGHYRDKWTKSRHSFGTPPSGFCHMPFPPPIVSKYFTLFLIIMMTTTTTMMIEWCLFAHQHQMYAKTNQTIHLTLLESGVEPAFHSDDCLDPKSKQRPSI